MNVHDHEIRNLVPIEDLVAAWRSPPAVPRRRASHAVFRRTDG
jgi:hypothetical protein